MPQGTFNDIIKKHFSTKIFLIGIILSVVTLVIEKCSCRFAMIIYQLDYGVPSWVSIVIESISFISFFMLFTGLFIFRRHCLGLSKKDGLLLVAITSIINVAVSIEKSILLLYSGINYASIVSLIPLALQIAITIGIISGINDFKCGKNPQHTADALIFALFIKLLFVFSLCVVGVVMILLLIGVYSFVASFHLLFFKTGDIPVSKLVFEASVHLISILISPSSFVSSVMYLSVLFRIKNNIKKLDCVEE